MQKLLYKFAAFMQGRNGYDNYGSFLIISGLIIGLIGSFSRLWIFSLLGDLILFYEIYRMFSRNLVKRGIENDHYMHASMMLKHRFLAIRKQFSDHENHYYVCPQCGQIVRVPKGHGKITVTCPNCHNEFDRKS